MATYIQIATATGTGSSATLTFSSIPATYTDLLIKFSLRSTTTGVTNFNVTLNSTNPTQKNLEGSGTSATSNSNTYNYAPAAGITADIYSNGELYIPNYLSSNAKSVSLDNVTENNSATSNRLELTAKLYSSATSAITTISITDIYGNWTNLSTAYLYGIKNS